VGLEVAVQRLLEEPASAQVGTPRLLLAVTQPARLIQLRTHRGSLLYPSI